MKYALLSVYDKTGLDKLITGLSRHGFSIISTGGTYKASQEIIKKNNLDIKLFKVSEITKSPEMLGGRVKTLHPKILGSILYDRDKKEHLADAEKNGLIDICIVAVNLYPFEYAMKKNAPDDDLIEEIDIGGPTMLISAVKNHKHVAIVTDPADYGRLIDDLDRNDGKVSLELKKESAVKAINLLADYRGMIAGELTRRFSGQDTLRISGRGKKLGRYGENWHQEAWLFQKTGLADAEQLAGIPLGYNNYLDANAALLSVLDLKDSPAVSIVKHSNPCGYATGKDLRTALERAWEGDDISAFGGIIAFSRNVDLKTAGFFDDKFIEVLIVPDIDDDALEHLKLKRKNLRVLQTSLDTTDEYEFRSIDGGILRQTTDDMLYLGNLIDKKTIDDNGKERVTGIVTRKRCAADIKGLAEFSIKAVKHLRSNAIAVCCEYEKGHYQLLGMGCGQPNRLDSVKLAVDKAFYNLKKQGLSDKDIKELFSSNKIILSSDAFFPFGDSIDVIAESGIRHIVQPGGSIKDREVIESADRHGMVMMFSGMRHFRH